MDKINKSAIIVTEAIRYYFVICKLGWWKRFPFLPIPTRTYIKWRLDTAYGGSFKRPPLRIIIRDISKFLIWRYKIRKEK